METVPLKLLLQCLSIQSFCIPITETQFSNSKDQTSVNNQIQNESDNLIQRNLSNISDSSYPFPSNIMNHEIKPIADFHPWWSIFKVHKEQVTNRNVETKVFNHLHVLRRQRRFIDLNEESIRKDVSAGINYEDFMAQNKRAEPRIISIFSVISFSDFACQGNIVSFIKFHAFMRLSSYAIFLADVLQKQFCMYDYVLKLLFH